MLHARGQSTAVLQQQHVDRLHRHTIHTTSAGMAHANGPTARATVNSTSWWWGQEQRVLLNFGDADTTQKATGATSAQLDFVCVIRTSNSSTAAVPSLSPPLSLCVFVQGSLPKQYRHFLFIFSPNEQRARGGVGALPDFFFFFFSLFSRPRAGLATV